MFWQLCLGIPLLERNTWQACWKLLKQLPAQISQLQSFPWRKAKVRIGMLVAQSPDLLLVDEPVAGLTDAETQQIGSYFWH